MVLFKYFPQLNSSIFCGLSRLLEFTELTSKIKYSKNTNAMIGYRTPWNKNVKKRVENAHTEENIQNAFVVPNF